MAQKSVTQGPVASTQEEGHGHGKSATLIAHFSVGQSSSLTLVHRCITRLVSSTRP